MLNMVNPVNLKESYFKGGTMQAALIVLFVLIVAGGWFVYQTWRKVDKRLKTLEAGKPQAEPTQESKPVPNITPPATPKTDDMKLWQQIMAVLPDNPKDFVTKQQVADHLKKLVNQVNFALVGLVKRKLVVQDGEKFRLADEVKQ